MKVIKVYKVDEQTNKAGQRAKALQLESNYNKKKSLHKSRNYEK